jgi:xanthine dehydrogenase YagS FAD-binding subunit
MNAFAYVSADSPRSAVTLVRGNGRFIAGGVDLLGEMKEGLATPERLVNIKNVPGTRDIVVSTDRWVIGANVTLTTLAEHVELRRALPAIAEAADHVGSPQMRNVATLGGNLAQHSRCWYYRQRDLTCAKKGGKRCLARDGENKYHSLFSDSPCLSPCVANLAIALTALDARVVVQRGGSAVTLTMPQLYETAWKSARAHNSLRADDLILRVEVPVRSGLRCAYLQMAEKHEFDWALVSCAVAANVDGKTLRSPRVVLGCVAPIPWQVAKANALLEGKAPSDETAAATAADLLLKEATPRAHNAYKLPLAKALVRRTLAKLA